MKKRKHNIPKVNAREASPPRKNDPFLYEMEYLTESWARSSVSRVNGATGVPYTSGSHILLGKKKKQSTMPLTDSLYTIASDFTQKINSGKNLLNKTIKYIPTVNNYSANIVDIKSAIETAKSATEWYSFDFETLGGVDKHGIQRHDYLIEVSFQNYKGSIGSINHLAPSSDSFGGLLGLTKSEVKEIEEKVLNDFFGGDILSIDKLTPREKVYISELIKYSDMDTTVDSRGIKHITRKMSQEDAERIIKYGNIQSMRQKVRAGLSAITIDDSYKENQRKWLFDQMGYTTNRVINEPTVMLAGANTINYDVPFGGAQGLNLPAIPANKHLDVTAVMQMYQNESGEYSLGGRQLSNMYTKRVGNIPQSMVPHIGDTDTKLTMGVLQSIMQDPKIINAYQNAPVSQFGVGSIFMPRKGVSSIRGYYIDPKTGEYVDPTGGYRAAGKNKKLEPRVWNTVDASNGYAVSLLEGRSYTVIGLEKADFSTLSNVQREEFIQHFGDDYKGSPIYHLRVRPGDADGFNGTLGMDVGLVLPENQLKQYVNGFDVVGSVKDGNSPMTKESIQATRKRAAERAWTKYNSPEIIKSLALIAPEDQMALAQAYASNKPDAINAISKNISTKFGIGGALLHKRPESISALTSLLEHGYGSYAPIAKDVIEAIQRRGMSEYETRIAMSNAFQFLQDNLWDASDAVLTTEFGTDAIMPNRLRLELPKLLKGRPGGTSYTLDFTKEASQYGIFKALAGDGYDDLSPFEQARTQLSVAKQFIEEAQNDPIHGTAIKKEFASSNISEQWRSDKVKQIYKIHSDASMSAAEKELAYGEVIEDLNRAVYESLYIGGMRSRAPMPSVPINLDEAIKNGNGRFGAMRITDKKQISDAMVSMIDNGFFDTHSYSAQKSGVDALVQKAMDAFISPEIRTADAYKQYLIEYGASPQFATARQTMYGQTLQDYADMLTQLIYTANAQGLDIEIGNDGMFVGSGTAKRSLGKVPKLIASNGSAGVQYGKKVMELGYKPRIVNGEIKLTSDFAPGRYLRNTFERMVSQGEAVTPELVDRALGRTFSELANGSDIMTVNAHTIRKSGGGISIFDIASNLFEYTDRQSSAKNAPINSSYLAYFQRTNPKGYDEIKEAWDALYRNPRGSDSIVNMSTNLYERLLKYEDQLLYSFSQSTYGNTAVNQIFASISPTSFEQDYKGDVRRVGIDDTHALSRFQQRRRPVGTQIDKSMYVRSSALKKVAGVKPKRVVETSATKSINHMKAAYGISGLDLTNSFTAKMALINPDDWSKMVDEYFASTAGKYNTYGDDAERVLRRMLQLVSTANDGSIMTADLAMALANDQKNNVTISNVFNPVTIKRAHPGKNESTDAMDFIPDYKLNPDGTVTIKYKDNVFLENGDVLLYHETTSIAEGTTKTRSKLQASKNIKRNVSMRGVFVTDTNIALSQREANKLINQKLSSEQRALLSTAKTKSELTEMISKFLEENNAGVQFKLVGTATDLGVKVGFGGGEEKSATNVLVGSLDQTAKGRALIEKITDERARRIVTGHTVTDETIDLLPGLTREERKRAKELIRLPDVVARDMLEVNGYGGAHIIANPNFKKHDTVTAAIDEMLGSLSEKMPKDDFQTLLKEIDPEGHLSYKRNQIYSDGDLTHFNIDKLYAKYRELFPDENKVITITGHAMANWDGRKYSGAHTAGEIERIKTALANGEISTAEAHRRLEAITSDLSAFGRDINVAITDVDTLSRQQWNRISSDKMLRAMSGADPSDTFLARKIGDLKSENIIVGNNGSYQLSEDALGKSYLANTIERMKDSAQKGSYGLRVKDYLADGSEKKWLSEEDWALIEKYGNDAKYGDHTIEALRNMDITKAYVDEIKPLNGIAGKRHLNQSAVLGSKYDKYNKVHISDLAIRLNSSDTDIMHSPNNPYTKDVIIDLGADFSDSGQRYTALKGLPMNMYERDGENNIVLYDYQQSVNKMYDDYSDYDALKSGRLSDERQKQLFGERFSSLNENEKLSILKTHVLDDQRQVVDQYAKFVVGKKGIASKLINPGAAVHSAYMQTQTLMFDDTVKGLDFGGMTLGEHFEHGRLINHGMIGKSDFAAMGFYDPDVMKKQIDIFSQARPEEFAKIQKNLGDAATSEAIVDKIYSQYGISMIVGKTPHIGDESVVPYQMYMDSRITDGQVRLNQTLQDRMKDDDDGDKAAIYAFDDVNQKEMENAMFARSYANRNEYVRDYIIRPSAEELSSIEKILDKNTMFGEVYSNLRSNEELAKAHVLLQESQYAKEFDKVYNATLSAGSTLSERSDAFLKQATEMAGDYDDDFVDTMKEMFVAKTRITRNNIAAIALGSKAKVGSVNNPLENLFDVITDYTSSKIGSGTAGIDYDIANSFSRYIKESAIENTINAKNTVTADAGELTSRIIERARTALTGGYHKDSASRKAAMIDLSGIFTGDNGILNDATDKFIFREAGTYNEVVDDLGNKSIRWSFDADSEFGQWLTNKGVDLSTFASDQYAGNADAEATMAMARKAVMGNFSEKVLETNIQDNEKHISKLSFGKRNSAAYDQVRAELDDFGVTDRAYRAREAFEAATDNKSTYNNAAENIGRMSADLLSNINIGKGLAVEALGIAAGIMAAGFIGGNPSHAPQDDAPQLANPDYQNDNYNYDTGMVMAPPQMPQRGYVVNMRGTTRGSFGEAQRGVAIAAQQSYVPNMNLSVRQNFSYSGTKKSNDRYVEEMITKLFG